MNAMPQSIDGEFLKSCGVEHPRNKRPRKSEEDRCSSWKRLCEAARKRHNRETPPDANAEAGLRYTESVPEPQKQESPKMAIATETLLMPNGIGAIIDDTFVEMFKKHRKAIEVQILKKDRAGERSFTREYVGIEILPSKTRIVLRDRDLIAAFHRGQLAGQLTRIVPVKKYDQSGIDYYALDRIPEDWGACYVLTAKQWLRRDVFGILMIAENAKYYVTLVEPKPGTTFAMGGEQYKVIKANARFGYPHIAWIGTRTKPEPTNVEAGAKNDDAPQGGASQPSSNDQDNGQAQGTKPTPINGTQIVPTPNTPAACANAEHQTKPEGAKPAKPARQSAEQRKLTRLTHQLTLLFPDLISLIREQSIGDDEPTTPEQAFEMAADMTRAKAAIKEERERITEAARAVIDMVESILAAGYEELAAADLKAAAKIAKAVNVAVAGLDDNTRELMELNSRQQADKSDTESGETQH